MLFVPLKTHRFIQITMQLMRNRSGVSCKWSHGDSMTHRILLPRIMQIGHGARHSLPELLTSLHCKVPLIITDSSMVKLGYIQDIQNILRQAELQADYFDDTIAEPTASSIDAGVDYIRKHQYDAIIAVGGGSVIDSAKAMSILGPHGGKIRDYRFPRQVNITGLPLIAVPTTAGTGSEATQFTVISDDHSHEKMLCVGSGFMPIAAVIDYELTLSLPARTTADSGMDALTHAIEAYVSQKANPYSDAQAIAAMQLLGPNLELAYFQPNNHRAREAMMLGASLAGIAFCNASVALVHGMSRPIGAFFHVAHGLSNAMLLPLVTAFSISAAPERYAACAVATGVAHLKDSVDLANQKLIQALYSLKQVLEVPSLQQLGVAKQDFDHQIHTMAEQAIASGSPANNPRIASKEDIVQLYQKLWDQGEPTKNHK